MRVLFVFVLVLAGCTGKKPEPAAVPKERFFEVDPASAGHVKGRVIFTGKVSPARRISMEAEKACADLHPGGVNEQVVERAADGGLANVFVYVKRGLEGKKFAPPTESVVLDQKGCQYVPRVVALRAGQTLTVKNSDPVSHNIHPQPIENRDWNQQQPPGAEDLRRRFAHPEVMIPVKCNVHSWMRSYIGVLEHPYFAVTKADGQYAFPKLPPGEYVVAAWHEQFGETEQTVKVGVGENRFVEFAWR